MRGRVPAVLTGVASGMATTLAQPPVRDDPFAQPGGGPLVGVRPPDRRRSGAVVRPAGGARAPFRALDRPLTVRRRPVLGARPAAHPAPAPV